jgi:sterol desaturase/sphingolipid hydroxylase (fatty acid hydroxylase superfamily)
LIRLSAFIVCFALLAFAERRAPRRRLAIPLRDRWGGNLGLAAIDTIVLRTVPPITTVGLAALAHARGWGLLGAVVSLPTWLDVVLSVVVLDLAIYLQHRLFHAVPLPWRLHRVHHTDLELDVTTGLRFHPVEMLLSVGFKAGVVAVLGPPVVGVVLFEVLLNAGSLFSHANLRLGARRHGDRRRRVRGPRGSEPVSPDDPAPSVRRMGIRWPGRARGSTRGDGGVAHPLTIQEPIKPILPG